MKQKSSFILVAMLSLSQSALADCLNTEVLKSSEEIQANRAECLKKSRFLLPQPNLNQESLSQLLVHPEGKRNGLKNDEVVHCRYVYQKQNGNSAKFRCAKTNEQNQLFDSKGELVPEASGMVSENDEVYLTDRQNQKLMQATKKDKMKARKALILKVRYQDGSKRNVENYTSAAASRIFWLLGVPTHSNYMTQKIVCFGCGPDPFKGQQQPLYAHDKPVITEFVDANIEVKFDGERLYKPTQNPWKWSELNKLSGTSSNEIRTELEVLALAAHFIGAVGKTSMQNAIVCKEFAEDNKSKCIDVVAMIHDIGAGLGSRLNKGLFGGDYPRGDLSAYNNTTIFTPGSCEFSFTDQGRELPKSITAAGKAEFLKRAQLLTDENLQKIVQAAHLGNLHNLNQKTKVAKLEGKWVSAIKNKLKEIQMAPCQ